MDPTATAETPSISTECVGVVEDDVRGIHKKSSSLVDGDPSDRKWSFQSLSRCETIRNLQSDYGVRLLIMISLCSHWCKGFCRQQYAQSIRYLLQAWMVPGPRLDVYTAIIDIPWSMKPIIAICSDTFPVLGYRKRPYMVVTSILCIFGLCASCFLPVSSIPVEVPVIGLFLSNFGWMTSDILVEGLYSRRMAERPKSGPDLVVFVSIGQQLTFVISSVISGLIIDRMDGVLGLTGAQWNIATCLIPSVAILYPTIANYLGESKISSIEAKCNRAHVWKTQKEIVLLSGVVGSASLLFACVGIVMDVNEHFAFCVSILCLMNLLCWGFFNPLVGKLAVFLALASVTNLSMAGPSHYFYTDNAEQYPAGPHFEPWFFVTVCGLVGAVTCIVALMIYAKFKTARYRVIYAVFVVINAAITLPNSILFSRKNIEWGISDYVFVGSDTALQTAISVLYFTPGFLLLSRICPDQLESSMFAILASNTNFAMTIAGPISGYMSVLFGITPSGAVDESAKFEKMWIGNLVVAAVKLVPLAFIFLIPNLRMTDRIEGVKECVTANSPYKKLMSKLVRRPQVVEGVFGFKEPKI